MSVHGDPAPEEDESTEPRVDGADGTPPSDDPFASESLSQEFVRSETHRLRRIAKDLLPSDGDRDDLVQDVWLEALEHPPRSKGRLSAWLRVVTNHAAHRFWRRSRTRADRERRAAKSESEPSVLDALEREAARAELRKWIEDLRPPYREVLLLHFFEGASPSEIAERLQRRPATVRSQLKRGLEQLRARYDGGGARAELGVGPWLAALLGAAATSRRARGSRRPAVLRAASIAAGLLALTAAVLWIERSRSDTRPALEPDLVARVESPGAALPSPVDASGAGRGARRIAVEDLATPAPADAGTRASAPVLPPDPATVVEYAVAGRTTDILGRNVADAEIWISPTGDPADARLAAHSDSSGRYQVPDARGDFWIWAEEIDNGLTHRLRVFAPGSQDTVQRDLTFGSNNGRLRGVVRDARGDAVPGALVCCACALPARIVVGTDAEVFARSRGAPRTTDEKGRFQVARIQMRGMHVLVLAPGEAPFALRNEGKDTKPIEIVLPAAAALAGAILEPDGAPAAGVEVLLEHPDPLPASHATTTADGSFRFEHVPPGRFTLQATGTGGLGAASWLERGELLPGESRRLAAARLSDAWTIRGEALAHGATLANAAQLPNAAPPEGWTVTLVEETSRNAGAARRTRTSKDGTFVFTGCAEGSYTLELFPPGPMRGSPHAMLREVRPGGEPVVLEFSEGMAPRAWLRGTLDDAQVPAGDAVLVVARPSQGAKDDRTAAEALVDRATGAFEIGPLLPGAYAVEANHPVFGRMPLVQSVSLGAGATMDLGHLAPPRRGTLVVHWSQAWGTGAETFAVTLTGERFFLIGRRQNPGSRMQIDEASHEVRIADLVPGAYRLLVQGASVATDRRTVRIEEDATCTVELPLREGAPGEIRVTGPRPLDPDETVVVTVHAADGAYEFPLRDDNRIDDDLDALLHFRVTLPPGTNRIEVATSGGLHGERPVETKGHIPYGQVRIELR